MSYAELPEFSCWLAVIGSQHKCQLNSIIFISFSPYDDTLSVRGTTVVNGKNRQEFPPSLYQPDCTLLCFLLRELNKNVLSGERSDLLRNKVFGFVSIYFSQLFNLVYILLNVSSKSLENAKYMNEKFRRVCKRKAETQHQLQLMYWSSIIVNALNNLLCRKLYNNEIAQLSPGAFLNVPKLTHL